MALLLQDSYTMDSRHLEGTEFLAQFIADLAHLGQSHFSIGSVFQCRNGTLGPPFADHAEKCDYGAVSRIAHLGDEGIKLESFFSDVEQLSSRDRREKGHDIAGSQYAIGWGEFLVHGAESLDGYRREFGELGAEGIPKRGHGGLARELEIKIILSGRFGESTEQLHPKVIRHAATFHFRVISKNPEMMMIPDMISAPMATQLGTCAASPPA